MTPHIPVVFGWENVYTSGISCGYVCKIHGIIPRHEAQWMLFDDGDGHSLNKVVCPDCITKECDNGSAIEISA